MEITFFMGINLGWLATDSGKGITKGCKCKLVKEHVEHENCKETESDNSNEAWSYYRCNKNNL